MSKEIKDILHEVAEIVEKKEHDYGSAFDRACELLGPTYASGKIYEKTMRIITLTQSQARVENEGLDDALRDCIGYCALYLRRRSNDERTTDVD